MLSPTAPVLKYRQCENMLCGCPVAERGKPCPYCGAYEGESVYPFERAYLDEQARIRREAEWITVRDRRARRMRNSLIIGAVVGVTVFSLIAFVLINNSVLEGQLTATRAAVAANEATASYLATIAPTLTLPESRSATNPVGHAALELNTTSIPLALTDKGGTYYGVDATNNLFFRAQGSQYAPLGLLGVNAAEVIRVYAAPSGTGRWLAVQSNNADALNLTFYDVQSNQRTVTNLSPAVTRGIADLAWSPDGSTFSAILTPAASGDRSLLIVPFDSTNGTTPAIQSLDGADGTNGTGIVRLVTRDQVAAIDYFPDGATLAFIVGKTQICPGWCLQLYSVATRGLGAPVTLLDTDQAAALSILRLRVSREGDRIALLVRDNNTGAEQLHIMEYQPRRTLYSALVIGANAPLIWLPGGVLLIRSTDNLLVAVDVPRRQLAPVLELSRLNIGALDWMPR